MPDQPWLPWIAAGLACGAAGLCAAQWWWLAPPAALLAVVAAGRMPWTARWLIALAAFSAGGWVSLPPSQEAAGPRLLAVAGTVGTVAYHGHRQGFVVAVEDSDDPGGYRPARVWVVAPPLPAVASGDRVAVRGLWSRDRRGDRVDGVELERTAMREEGPRGFAWRALERLESHRELAEALLLGQGRPPEIEAFRRTGLIHLLAVSGMHLVIAAALGAWLLRVVGLPWLLRHLALGGLLVGYTWLTAGSPATVRALAMAMAMLLYDLAGREAHRLGALSLAVVALILWDPLIARDLGFQLSVVAVLGLITLGAELVALRERWLPLQPWPLDRPTWRGLLFTLRSACDGLAIGVAATLATAPLLAASFGAVAPWSAFTTLIASPPCTVALWSGLPLIAGAGLWPDGPWEGLYRLVEGALDALMAAVTWADRLPGRTAMGYPAPWLVLLWPLPFVTGRWLGWRVLLAMGLVVGWAWG